MKISFPRNVIIFRIAFTLNGYSEKNFKSERLFLFSAKKEYNDWVFFFSFFAFFKNIFIWIFIADHIFHFIIHSISYLTLLYSFNIITFTSLCISYAFNIISFSSLCIQYIFHFIIYSLSYLSLHYSFNILSFTSLYIRYPIFHFIIYSIS